MAKSPNKFEITDMQNTLVNVNGEILPAAQAQVSIFDRGFLYGDSLYEVMRSHNGKLMHLKEHLIRLEASAKLCRMVLGQSTDIYAQEIEKTFTAFLKMSGHAQTEAYCRLIVTRGVGKIGFGLNCLKSPTQYFIIVQPLELPTAAQFEKGMAIQVAARLRNDPRALDPAMKSGNYLNSLLAYLEATAEDYDDAIMLNHQGHVTEGTTFNIFYVHKNIVITPPLDIGILDGITRLEVLREAKTLGFETREARFPKERLYEADEVFVTSTIREVFPVTSIDRKSIAGGRPGSVTRKLKDAYKKSIEQNIS